MEIIIGKNAGFCYGVKRAVDGCEQEINNSKEKNIFCLGEIVHNKQVVTELEKKGIKFIEDINEISNNATSNTKMIIRAHGIDKNIYNIAKSRNIEVQDFTCPNVLKIHKIAEDYTKDGYFIFLTGAEKHPEIVGTISYCGENYRLIKDEEDVQNAILDFKNSKINKLLLISQTTYSMKKFENIKNSIEKEISKETKLVIKNTICLATETRQKETKKLSSEVDKMIIIGGKNSSNTKKLYEIAKENCKETVCIETKEELDKNQFEKCNKIGIMAGASTPQKSIDEVVKLLENL